MFVKIKDYPDYSINEKGEVMNKHSKLLKPHTAGRGYYCYQLSNEKGRKNEYIHRLVAKTFIPNPHNLPQVDHIDGDKSNNNVDNLRWVSNYDNAHAFGYYSRLKKAADAVRIRVVAIKGETRLKFDSKSDLLRHFGYTNVHTRVKINEEYHYGNLKGFTIYYL